MNLLLVTDIVVIILLTATIVYCFRLNKKLAGVRQDRILMHDLIQGFSVAISKAQLTVEALRQPTLKLVTDLTQRKDEGEACRDELIFLIERAEILASTLEENISGFRQETQNLPKSPKSKPSSGGSSLASELSKVRVSGTHTLDEIVQTDLKTPINKTNETNLGERDQESQESSKIASFQKAVLEQKGSHLLAKVSQNLASEGKNLIESLKKLR